MFSTISLKRLVHNPRFKLVRNLSTVQTPVKKQVRDNNNAIVLAGSLLLTSLGYCYYYNKIENNASTHGHDFLNVDTIPMVKAEELKLHNTADDCWVSIHGHVYDVTEFVQMHPGGADKLLRFAGKDATRSFRLQHPEGHLEQYLDETSYIGELLVPVKEKKERKKVNKKVVKEKTESLNAKDELNVEDKDGEDYYRKLVQKYIRKGKERSKPRKQVKQLEEIYNEETKPSLSNIFSINDFEYVAKKVLPELLYTYIQSGSDNEVQRYENRASLCRIFFRPKCLIDVENIDFTNEVINVENKLPFLIGPFSGSGLIQEDGEKLVVKSAVSRGVLQIIPKDSDSSIDELMKESNGNDLFYQYSIDTEEELQTASRNLNDIISKYPNIKGIFVNIDNSSLLGNLEHYKKIEASRNQYEYNPAPQLNPNQFKLCWEDLNRIKDEVKVPIILKGVQRTEDIVKSKKLGFKGVLISNHEGKLLDQSQAPIKVLYDTNKLLKGGAEDGLDNGEFEIFVEGGFRRGSDIVKALCLGGKPIISKPILFSEIYGEEGVNKSIDILRNEVERTMKLIGAKTVKELNREFIDCESLDFKLSATQNLDYMYDSNYSNMPPPPFNNQDKLVMVK